MTQSILHHRARRTAYIAPGAMDPADQWPAEQWAALTAHLHRATPLDLVLVHDGARDCALVIALTAHLPAGRHLPIVRAKDALRALQTPNDADAIALCGNGVFAARLATLHVPSVTLATTPPAWWSPRNAETHRLVRPTDGGHTIRQIMPGRVLGHVGALLVATPRHITAVGARGSIGE